MSDIESREIDERNELTPVKYIQVGGATPYIRSSRMLEASPLRSENFASYTSARMPIELTIGTNAGVIVETHTERTVEKIFYPGSTTIKFEAPLPPQLEMYDLEDRQITPINDHADQRHLVIQKCASGVFVFALFLVIGNQLSGGHFAHPLLIVILLVSSVGFYLMGVAGRQLQGE